jgi:adenylate cyclase
MGRTAIFPTKGPLAPLICFGIAALFATLQTPTRMEWRSLDERTAVRSHFQKPPSPEIAIVLYGDVSDGDLEPWPVDRKWHAQIMRLLSAAKPAVLSWDIIFDANGKTPAGDKSMGDIAAALGRIGIPVISAAVTDSRPDLGVPDPNGTLHPIGRLEGDVANLEGDDYAVLPFPHLRESSRYAFVDTPPGPDGIRREVPVVVRVGKKVYPSLGLATILAYLHVDPADVLVRLGDAVQFVTNDRLYRIPISEHGTYWLNYRYDGTADGTEYATAEYFPLMSALHAKYVEHDAKREVLDLKGKIVFFGEVVTGKADIGPTPRGGNSPLVLIHANFVDNVLRGDFVRRVPIWEVCLVLAAATSLGYGWIIRRPAFVMALIAVAGILAYVLLAFVVWILWSIWLPIVGPVLGLAALDFEAIVQRIRTEQRAKEQVKAKFQSYLPPELVEKMIGQEVKSERRPVTIVFTDLRDFTGWSERVSETELIEQLNEYLAAMVECIHEHGGTLHKFIGDAVMAAWGDFVSDGPTADAERACRAAFAMQARLAELNRHWETAGRQKLRMGVGVNHGMVLVGNVGSPRRMEYTLIGDAVNLASRLESLTKDYSADILAGESVWELLKDRFEFVPLGSIPVKGKLKLVSVFKLVEDNRRMSDGLQK